MNDRMQFDSFAPTRLDKHALRKVAILVSCLDESTADKLLSQMPLDQAASVREYSETLGSISAEEKRNVLSEFVSQRKGKSKPVSNSLPIPPSQNDGVELELSPQVSSSPSSNPSAQSNSREAIPETNSKYFRFLHNIAPQTIAAYLVQENSQLATLVIAHLPPSQAAAVLSQLPRDRQIDILRRLCDLDATQDDIVQDLESVVHESLTRIIQNGSARSAGLAAVVSILKSEQYLLREEVTAQLVGNLPALATEFPAINKSSSTFPNHPAKPTVASPRMPAARSDLKELVPGQVNNLKNSLESEKSISAPSTPPSGQQESSQPSGNTKQSEPIQSEKPKNLGDLLPEYSDADVSSLFDGLSNLDNASIEQLLKSVPPRVFLLSLAGANESLVNRLLSRLPKREEAIMRQRLNQSGPVRVPDILQAQRIILIIAQKLASTGQIKPLRGGQISLAA